ncbi:thymidine phosphorylase [Candidatus Pacearchaeota archaeon]|nr:thymidine phosphorylase [Candidatus Pacearchaeota archaeon]
MKLKVKRLHLLTGKPVCMIHEKTAKKLSFHVGYRVLIQTKKKLEIISVIDTVSGSLIKENEIGVSEEIFDILKIKNKDFVEVTLAERPRSIELIKKKLAGKKLSKKEIHEIIINIAKNSLTEVEVAFFISAVYTHELNLQETKWLIDAMVDSGNKINISGKIVDKHCIGGIAGNRTTPIVVAICAANDLIMPKTSSRAITSAAGTSDTIETIAKVDFSINQIKKIIKKTNACLVWGGALGLAPVDDKIIKIEKTIKIDSTSQLLASILSKKISVGSKYVLIDIPYGKSAKVNKKQAKILKYKFNQLGKMFKLKMKVILTNGTEPIGNGIGPSLEIKDVIKVLNKDIDAPKDLEEKSLILAGKILELTKTTKNGYKKALETLNSKKAYKKFIQIIKAQDGKITNIKKAKFSFDINSNIKIKIIHLDNKFINSLARRAGCPEDKNAGVYIHKKKGEIVEKKNPIITIYAETQEKLNHAKKYFKKYHNKSIIFREI